MKNQNSIQANNSNQYDSLMWLKIDGYKSNNRRAKSSEHDNLMWLKIDGYKSNKLKSETQNVITTISSVNVFFRALFLL